MRRKLPRNVNEAVSHLGTVEVEVTPILDIFCKSDENCTLKDVLKHYKRMKFMVYPHCASKIDSKARSRYMQILCCALDQLETTANYEVQFNRTSHIHRAIIPWTVTFDREVTEVEDVLDELDQLQRKRDEWKNGKNKRLFPFFGSTESNEENASVSAYY